MEKLDIVYPLIQSQQDNIEFRYSLRSLINLPHRDIYIVWYLPSWINKKKVKHIDYSVYSQQAHIITSNKLHIASLRNTLSDDFIYMNDDIYVLNPIEKIPYYIVWSLEDHLQYFQEKNMINSYSREILQMYNRFPKWDSFEAHTPIIYNKAKIAMFVNIFWIEPLRRSNYCNYYDIKWEKVVSYDYRNTNTISDCKFYWWWTVYCPKPVRFIKNQDYVSSNGYDESLFGRLEYRYPDKSPYEL